MPFLALAIGVDDTYVMLGAWQDTKRNLPPSKRMALTLQEAGRLAKIIFYLLLRFIFVINFYSLLLKNLELCNS